MSDITCQLELKKAIGKIADFVIEKNENSENENLQIDLGLSMEEIINYHNLHLARFIHQKSL